MTKCIFSQKLATMWIGIIFLIGCSPAATEAQPTLSNLPNLTSTPIPEITVGIVEVDLLNIREGPGTSYPILISLNKDEKFPILGEVTNNTNNKWLLISLADNSFGWVAGDQSYVTVQKEIVDLNTFLTWQKNVESGKSLLVISTPSP